MPFSFKYVAFWKIRGYGESELPARRALNEVETIDFRSREEAIEAAECALQTAGLFSVDILVKMLRVELTAQGRETRLLTIDGYATRSERDADRLPSATPVSALVGRDSARDSDALSARFA